MKRGPKRFSRFELSGFQFGHRDIG